MIGVLDQQPRGFGTIMSGQGIRRPTLVGYHRFQPIGVGLDHWSCRFECLATASVDSRVLCCLVALGTLQQFPAQGRVQQCEALLLGGQHAFAHVRPRRAVAQRIQAWPVLVQQVIGREPAAGKQRGYMVHRSSQVAGRCRAFNQQQFATLGKMACTLQQVIQKVCTAAEVIGTIALKCVEERPFVCAVHLQRGGQQQRQRCSNGHMLPLHR
ncbi:hypothetical protein D3C72_1462310 [compost metagenome]